MRAVVTKIMYVLYLFYKKHKKVTDNNNCH